MTCRSHLDGARAPQQAASAVTGPNTDDGSCSDGPTMAYILAASSTLQQQPPAAGSLSTWFKWSASSSSAYLPVAALQSRVHAIMDNAGTQSPIRASLSVFLGCPRPLASPPAQLCVEATLLQVGALPGQVLVARSLWAAAGAADRWRDGAWHHLVLMQVRHYRGNNCSAAFLRVCLSYWALDACMHATLA